MNEHLSQIIKTVVTRYSVIEWSWSLVGLKTELIKLGAVLESVVEGRQTFLLPEGLDLTIYHENDLVMFVEIDVKVFLNPHLLSDCEYEDKVDEFFEFYESAVTEAEKILGKPVFNDGSARDGFPEDQDAVWLALWELDNSRLMIQQKHEDKELPFRLTLVITPLTRDEKL